MQNTEHKTRKIMKTIAIFLTITLLSISPLFLNAQGAPPPPPGDHGQSGNQPAGNGAPIGSGLGILLALGAAYGGKKVWDYRRNMEE